MRATRLAILQMEQPAVAAKLALKAALKQQKHAALKQQEMARANAWVNARILARQRGDDPDFL